MGMYSLFLPKTLRPKMRKRLFYTCGFKAYFFWISLHEMFIYLTYMIPDYV